MSEAAAGYLQQALTWGAVGLLVGVVLGYLARVIEDCKRTPKSVGQCTGKIWRSECKMLNPPE